MHDGMMMDGHHVAQGMMDGSMMGGTLMVVWMVGLVLVVLALGAGAVWLARTITRDRDRGGRPDAIQHLQLRYARGEIDRDEYVQKHADLARE